jgi:hypothetical protein
MLTSTIRNFAYAIVASVMLVAPAYSATYTFDTIFGGVENQGGWADNKGDVNTSTPEYWVGASSTGMLNRRSFFTFNLAGLNPNEQVISATLQIYKPQDNSHGLTTVNFYDVTTTRETLMATSVGNGINQAIFNDLGSGELYGSVPLGKTDYTGQVVPVSLNAAALNGIAAAANGYFAIGAACAACANNWKVFFGGGSAGDQLLTIVTAPVPEPAEWAMLTAGLLVIGFIARRRRQVA